MAALVLAAFTLAAGGAVLLRGRFWPYGPCRSCQGRKGRGAGSTAEAYNRCRRCGGSGERIRLAAMAWPRHREELRRRKR